MLISRWVFESSACLKRFHGHYGAINKLSIALVRSFSLSFHRNLIKLRRILEYFWVGGHLMMQSQRDML